MHIRNAKNVQALTSEQGMIVYELLGAVAGGSHMHSLAQIVIPSGRASLKHYHPEAEESFYILSGTAQITIDGETAALGPGDSIVVLPEQVHQIFNTNTDDLVFLAVCIPPWTPSDSVFLD